MDSFASIDDAELSRVTGGAGLMFETMKQARAVAGMVKYLRSNYSSTHWWGRDWPTTFTFKDVGSATAHFDANGHIDGGMGLPRRSKPPG